MIELFDAQAGFGGPRAGETWVPTAEELLAQMGRLSIGRALVRSEFEDVAYNVPLSNQRLFETCARHRALVPCPVVLPAGCGDVPPEEEQVEAVARGGGAAVIRPARDSWSTAEWCSGTLFSLLQERCVPLLVRQSAISFETVADLAGRYPALPLVLFQVHYNTPRTLVPLLRAFPNAHVAMGCPFSVHGGVEYLAREVGARRLLFGTGFPFSDLMPGVTMLTYAAISEEEKALIGAGNLERLIGGVQR